jgi:hypothetical protein
MKKNHCRHPSDKARIGTKKEKKKAIHKIPTADQTLRKRYPLNLHRDNGG